MINSEKVTFTSEVKEALSCGAYGVSIGKKEFWGVM